MGKSRKRNTERNKALVADYLAGMSKFELSAKYGIGRRFLNELLARHGAPPRWEGRGKDGQRNVKRPGRVSAGQFDRAAIGPAKVKESS